MTCHPLLKLKGQAQYRSKREQDGPRALNIEWQTTVWSQPTVRPNADAIQTDMVTRRPATRATLTTCLGKRATPPR